MGDDRRGKGFPAVARSLKWEREPGGGCRAVVQSPESGVVALLLTPHRGGRRWSWAARGWLGVLYVKGYAATLADARLQAIQWWGEATAAERIEESMRGNRQS